MNHKLIVQIINNGGLVILPTDTVYGIMGDALNKEAISKVNKAKKRGQNKLLILLVDSIEMARKYTKDINKLEAFLFEKYSKYSLTIELQKSDKLPKEYNPDVTYVGIRIPHNDDLIKIIRMLGRPIFSTSANISGQPIVTDISMLDSDLKSYIDYIYDVGTIDNLASTILKVCDGKIVIIREGLAGDLINKELSK